MMQALIPMSDLSVLLSLTCYQKYMDNIVLRKKTLKGTAMET